MFLNNLPKELVKPFLDLAYTVASSDGKIADEETRNIGFYAKEVGLAELPECSIVDFDKVLDQFAVLDATLRKEVFFELLSMANADMVITCEEKALLDLAAKKFGITDEVRKQLEDVLEVLASGYYQLVTILQAD